MPIYGYIMVGLLAVNALITIALVGRPRKPLTGVDAAVVTALNAIFIWGLAELAAA